MTTADPGVPAVHRRSPVLAAFLSFLWPGLGQWYGGRPRAAALFALPLVVLAVILLAAAAGSTGQLATLLLTPSSDLTIVILVGLIAAWRILAIADAMSIDGIKEPLRQRTNAITFVVLTLIVVVMHGAVGYTAWAVYDASSRIFVSDASPEAGPPASLPPGATPDPAAEYRASPIATPATPQSRINVLLTGIDSAETRTTR